MQVSTPKTEGKLHHARSAWCISFLSVFGVDTCINPKNITTIPYHFISTLLNVNFDFDVTVANDVAIDVAKCSLPGKLMQWSPCPEVRTLTNENGRYMIKLNDYVVLLNCYGKVKAFVPQVDPPRKIKPAHTHTDRPMTGCSEIPFQGA